MRMASAFLCTALLASSAGSALGGYVIQGFAPTEYLGGTPSDLAVMRQNLGVNGLSIEDFDTSTLPSGPLTFSGSGINGVIPENGNSWGQTGTGFLGVTTTTTNPVMIQIAGGTSILGIGFSAFESGTGGALTSISINGGSLIPLDSATLPQFVFSYGIRNGYLEIKAGPGDPMITRVDLIQTGAPDGYQLDYLAFGAVPEPASFSLFALGMAGVFAYCCRKRWLTREKPRHPGSVTPFSKA
jgi:hypothetical protein